MKYFFINNVKYSYTLEFSGSLKNDKWKLNAPLIEYCETMGITIPHYCYHKRLSISGNCRMCLIELKNSPKPIVSCSLSAKACLNNGVVYTNSPLVKKARENILEFLLLNHPLDCPICDQGGECDLQDQSFFFGITKKRFYSFKRVVSDKSIGPIIKTVMTRCIHCTRCTRFASEIAGVGDLGIFGRGLNSEIGTYVNTIFNSELSGNVIDLCPVGALTVKPYAFAGRVWELKNIQAVDFLDGFGSNLELYIKKNQIIKVSPGCNVNKKTFGWISDKTRFAFDGMFSSTRILQGYLKTEDKIRTLTWPAMFDQIICLLYFHDHLNRHFFKTQLLIIGFSASISIEVLNLLILLSKKYSFIVLKNMDQTHKKIDIESSFLTRLSASLSEFLSSNLCFLIGTNTRYESPTLNSKIRQRYLKGNFKIVSLGSMVELTFPIRHVGLNMKLLKTIGEGNSFFCQDIVNSKNPLILCSAEVLKRKDSYNWDKLNNLFKKVLRITQKQWQNIHIINNSLNDSGINYLDNCQCIGEMELKQILGIYCLSTNFANSNFQKLVEFKLLKFFEKEPHTTRYILEQNSGFGSIVTKKEQTALNLHNYLNIPNSVFFETNGTYITTQGFFKRAVKIVSSKNQSKGNWQIIRKFFSAATSVTFISDSKYNKRIFFNCINVMQFQNFVGLHYYPMRKLLNLNFTNTKSPCNFFFLSNKYPSRSKKFFETKVRLWLDDFYIGGKDSYSKYSLIMIKCSKVLRQTHKTFRTSLLS